MTAVQSQVTSGNTRSCGCLRDEIKRQKRPAISRAETQAAREWVRQIGAVIGENGRLPDRIIASYRLHQTGHGDILGDDGFLDEQHVRGWALTHDRPLAARGRLPSNLWLEFADDYLTQHARTDVNYSQAGDLAVWCPFRSSYMGSSGHDAAQAAWDHKPAQPGKPRHLREKYGTFVQLEIRRLRCRGGFCATAA